MKWKRPNERGVSCTTTTMTTKWRVAAFAKYADDDDDDSTEKDEHQHPTAAGEREENWSI